MLESKALLSMKETALHLGVSYYQLKNMMLINDFPKPVYLSSSTKRWKRNDLEEWLGRGKSDEASC